MTHGADDEPRQIDATNDEHAVRAVIEASVSALNAQDADAFGALFAEDAEMVLITGTRLRGRAEIVDHHHAVWDRPYAASVLANTELTVRFIRPDVAITRAMAEITFNEGEDVRTATPMTVLVKDGAGGRSSPYRTRS